MDAKIPCALIHAIAQNCPKLRVVKIFSAIEAPLTDEAVRALLRGCSLLKETDVENAEGLGQELRVELAKCSNITVLWLEEWADMNRKLAAKIVAVCSSLSELHCKGCGDWISNDVLAACAQHCPLLQILNLPECVRVAGSAVAHLVKQCLLLRKVDLRECERVDDEESNFKI